MTGTANSQHLGDFAFGVGVSVFFSVSNGILIGHSLKIDEDSVRRDRRSSWDVMGSRLSGSCDVFTLVWVLLLVISNQDSLIQVFKSRSVLFFLVGQNHPPYRVARVTSCHWIFGCRGCPMPNSKHEHEHIGDVIVIVLAI